MREMIGGEEPSESIRKHTGEGGDGGGDGDGGGAKPSTIAAGRAGADHITDDSSGGEGGGEGAQEQAGRWCLLLLREGLAELPCVDRLAAACVAAPTTAPWVELVSDTGSNVGSAEKRREERREGRERGTLREQRAERLATDMPVTWGTREGLPKPSPDLRESRDVSNATPRARKEGALAIVVRRGQKEGAPAIVVRCSSSRSSYTSKRSCDRRHLLSFRARAPSPRRAARLNTRRPMAVSTDEIMDETTAAVRERTYPYPRVSMT